MSNHQKGTGHVDKDRRDDDEKMGREMKNTDARPVPERDLRGKGRQAIAQQRRERDFDKKDRDRSAQG